VTVRFQVDGKPQAWQRARMQRTGRRCRLCKQPVGAVRGFTAPETRAYEQHIALMANRAMRKAGVPLDVDEPLVLRVKFTLPRIKKPTWSVPARRPDLDNYLKGVLDGLEKGRVFKDDARIVDLRATKVYGDNPSTLIELWRY